MRPFFRAPGTLLAATLLWLLVATTAFAFDWPMRSGLRGDIAVGDLPPEARETLARIRKGGPHPYRRDGVVFQNREGRLRDQPQGYYREFTVETPGSRDRGAKRIIAGSGPGGDIRTSGEYYYTKDHYRSFWSIRE